MGLHAYLNFKGNSSEATEFYKTVFQSKEAQIMRFADMPPQPGQPPLSEEDKQKVMHAELSVFDSSIMISDVFGSDEAQFIEGNNVSILIQTKDKAEIDRVFPLLKVGSPRVVDLAPTFFSAYYGMVVDKFGIMWQFYLESEK